jgi:lipopolysaccharide export system protein LptA
MPVYLKSVRMKSTVLAAVLALSAPMAQSQDTNVTFGGLKTDTSQPVKVIADQLAVNQADGTATFTGNVVIVQGEMKMQAGSVLVTYSDDKKAIQTLHAEGAVTIATATDAATSQTADYTPDTGDLILQGDVVLTQGLAALSGQKMALSLKTGLGTMTGRVTTIFTPGKN